jgi:D-ribose pyranase
VLAALIAEWSLDRVLITHEMDTISPGRVAEMRALLGDIPFERVSHGELKSLAQSARATVRTGDTVPYANIIVVSG